MEWIATLLVLGGIAVFGYAASIIRRLVTELPAGMLRRDWTVFFAFVGFFAAGYAVYLVIFFGRHHALANLIVPVIFFCGACFVGIVARLMRHTALELRRMDVVEEASLTDALTGLRNRRAFDSRWATEHARARRYALPLALLVIDIDHFKSFNDRHGHAVGDRVLAAVGRGIARATRDSDVAARYGGEEFVVIVMHTGPQGAAPIAERLRVEVSREARTALAEAGIDEDVTVSVGIAGSDNAARGPEGLFERADRALYAAKRAGRNRVVIAESEGVTA